MDKLWAPWRINYIRNNKKEKGCLLCRMAKAKQRDNENLVFLRKGKAFCVLNKFPYNNGHVMICPLAHKKDLKYLTRGEVSDLIGLLIEAQGLLDKTLSPQGYNIGINIGKVSGAGVDKHLHIHLVPRWVGDTNFMPVISNTRVISQSLTELYRLLKRRAKNAQ